MSERIEIVAKLKKFLKEFDFSGISSARFFNTLCINAKEETARSYVINYFKLIDNPNVQAVIEKTKSIEFKSLIKELKDLMITVKPINSRFELYFGNQGTGKTTRAIKEYPTAEVMPCSSSFEPSDLLEVFDFDDGKKQLAQYKLDIDAELQNYEYNNAVRMQLIDLILKAGGKPKYKNSVLLNAMLEGKPVILDEINLLTRDCLRSLQAFLDNKEEFTFKDKKIKIKEGFKIIGTMNLEVNGQIESLPAPLVDRAAHIKEFELDNKTLVELAFGKWDQHLIKYSTF